ncbi:MAG: dihydroorotase family protein [Candidatus Nitrosocaldus sp.]|nr:dihydroorotase family protein [Candidatus Nitrosocaldus sp.]MDW8274986.1 dihydroorotase family protein [Candidatus Nitrosocaldus sp.]
MATVDMLVRDARVVIPRVGIVETNIVVDDGRIKGLTRDMVYADLTIDASRPGLYAIPGAIDPHVHYGVFTPIDRAAETESRSAAVGGVTTMMRMLRLYSRYRDRLDAHLEASKHSHIVDYAYHASILLDEHVEEMEYCVSKGITSFKLYMNLRGEIGGIYMDIDPYSSALVHGRVDTTEELVEATIAGAGALSCITLVHAEDPEVCSREMRRAREQGLDGLKAWSDSRPASSEQKAIAFVTDVARRYGADLYIVHVGSSQAIDAVMEAKHSSRGRVYVETCPHYLTHTYEFDLRGKVVPPLRSRDDVARVWDALKKGLIDCIGSDHVANRLAMKLGDGSVWTALAGFPGVATILPVLLSEGVNKGRITLERLVEVTSHNAARIFGLEGKGSLTIGSDADIVLVDMDAERRVTPEMLCSYSDYTIYDGMVLRGWPICTILRGSVIMEDGHVVGKGGYGRYIARRRVCVS